MSDAILWLVAIELLGLAFLPLTTWLLRSLPDRGYAFAKLLGLLLVTYGSWLLGSFVSTGTLVAIPVLIVLAAGGIGWWRGRTAVVQGLGDARIAIVIEEALFLGAFIIWTLLRVYTFHPAIAHTEQYMDLMLLTTSLRSPSFPPLDLWMSGHTVNYYYFGYLMWATLTRLGDVPVAVGYNLALSSIFAIVISGAYSLGFALTRRFGWALLAPLFLALLGNWHAILVQIPAGLLPANEHWWFFDSTRVVDGQNTINEFPFFSLMLGDLHPHVMALPVTLLAIALGVNVLFGPRGVRGDSLSAWVRLGLAAICVGSLFTINSWDFPTYLLVVGTCIGAAAYAWDPGRRWWHRPLGSIVALGMVGVLLYLPFYLHFRSLAHGIGPVTTRTPPGQFTQVFGLFLAGVVLLLGSLALLLQPTEEVEENLDLPAGERGSTSIGQALGSGYALAVVVIAALAVGLVLHAIVLIGIMLGAAGALLMLERVLNTAEPNRADVAALLLVLVACLALGFTEVFYLRDSFDGGAGYRMNTVFKFYYQGWTLLGLTAAYGVWRGWDILRRFTSPIVVGIVAIAVAVGVLGAAVYTVLAPTSSIQPDSGYTGLSGMAWLQTQQPGDYAAIEWLRQHAVSRPVELEAAGGDYQPQWARISTFSGLPTVMGWPGHEEQWRPGDNAVGQRMADVRTIYTTSNSTLARRLLHLYHVRFVVVGDTERTAYPGPPIGLDKFSRFMHVAFRRFGTIVYSW